MVTCTQPSKKFTGASMQACVLKIDLQHDCDFFLTYNNTAEIYVIVIKFREIKTD